MYYNVLQMSPKTILEYHFSSTVPTSLSIDLRDSALQDFADFDQPPTSI